MIVRVPDVADWNVVRVCSQHAWASLELPEGESCEPEHCPACDAADDTRSHARYHALRRAGLLEVSR